MCQGNLKPSLHMLARRSGALRGFHVQIYTRNPLSCLQSFQSSFAFRHSTCFLEFQRPGPKPPPPERGRTLHQHQPDQDPWSVHGRPCKTNTQRSAGTAAPAGRSWVRGCVWNHQPLIINHFLTIINHDSPSLPYTKPMFETTNQL